MSNLRSRLRSLEAHAPRVERSGCSRCDDPARCWRGVVVILSGHRLGRCPECQRYVDSVGNPIGRQGGGCGKVIVLEVNEEQRQRMALHWPFNALEAPAPRPSSE